MSYSFKMLLLGTISLLLVACTYSSNDESAGEYLDSTAVTTKVKASLVDQLGRNGFAVKVKTFRDEVQLSGFVDTLAIKQKAGRITAGVDGVRSVRNDLVIKSR